MPPLLQTRRQFVSSTALATVSLWAALAAEAASDPEQVLPKGANPNPLPLAHFPDRLHAFIWRNWPLVPIDRLATVLGTTARNVAAIAASIGLPKQPRISVDQQRRSYITVIKRNWHLLPYSQLLQLLNWTSQELAYTLREDDFLFVKLGGLKPRCTAITYEPPDPSATARATEIARILQQELKALQPAKDPLFGFVQDLSKVLPESKPGQARANSGGLRFCYSYFALYGDPLLDGAPNPYPDGYLAALAQSGVNGVWLQAVLYRLAMFPWDPELSRSHEVRIRNLARLIARARRHGIGVYLYLNEPRAMPVAFFKEHPALKGVAEGDHATLCTSQEEVRDYLSRSVASICRAVPELAGLFTITASENLTNCWSHGGGASCPRCKTRSPAEVIAGVNTAIQQGIDESGARTRLIAWDWGWANDWAPESIKQLPAATTLMSVSEWDLPITRGGVASRVGEYSVSAIGPGPRAQRHWAAARKRGLKVAAKIQAGNSWELSAVPYIPAVANVAQHAINLHRAKVDGLMLGWTLGGYPSPNLDVVRAVYEIMDQPANQARDDATLQARALLQVALRRHGRAATYVMQAWRDCSRAFSEFPYAIGVVYSAPLQLGPANLLWPRSTGYSASMVGFPYDDLNAWRNIYPPETFASQLEKTAGGFRTAGETLQKETTRAALSKGEHRSLEAELRLIRACAIHFQSVANQTRFVMARQTLAKTIDRPSAEQSLELLNQLIRGELQLARELYEIQQHDSRIGFEASNQYYYVPIDLAEKILNCRHLLDQWLPEQRRKHLA